MPFHKKAIGHSPFAIRENSHRTNAQGPMPKDAFTLIELLVVIAIIGVLATLGTFVYSDSQKKSRDTRRKSDLVAIQKALELAKQDSSGNYSYPICTPTATSCTATSSAIVNGSTTLATTYIKSVPTDPKTNTGYTYQTWNDNTYTIGCSAAGTCTAFRLIACLENAKDPQKDPNSPSGAPANTTICTVASGTVSYTLSNL